MAIKTPKSQPKKIKTTPTIKKIVVVKKTTVETGVMLSHFGLHGEKDRPYPIPQIIKGVTVNDHLLLQAQRVYKANVRQGTSSTKTRGEVTGSTRKIFRQKGTGRARHGSIKAPIFVGGGIVFGPKPRDHSLSLPKKMRRKALLAVLRDKAEQGKLSVVSGLTEASGKTKELVSLINSMGLAGKRLLVILDPSAKTAWRGMKNIDRVTVKETGSLSYLDAMMNEYLLFSEEAIEKLDKAATRTKHE
ncbi:50S ribosomal protein L4 [Candidatus Gottesmanbacteria bacterium]|nr:50S ribosomal protein L4 [Candidatus Gottesmanbacteria bacterium]